MDSAGPAPRVPRCSEGDRAPARVVVRIGNRVPDSDTSEPTTIPDGREKSVANG